MTQDGKKDICSVTGGGGGLEGGFIEQRNDCLCARNKHPRFQKEASDGLIIHSTGQNQTAQEGAKQPHILRCL